MDGIITPEHLNTLKKIDNLWFDDADVIFCAGSSKFRVYRGILSLQSSVFRDMFSLPQNQKGNADARGSGSDVAAVIVLPDDEKDVHYFFLAIFDASFYHPPPSTYALEVTISILRLAHKYNIPFLIQYASAHLAFSFPLDKEALSGLANNSGSNTNTDPDPSQTLKDYLEVLRLAYVTDTQWILPSLLYAIVKNYGTSFIIMHPSFAGLAPHSQLPLVECAMGRELEESHHRTAVGILPSDDCETIQVCRHISITCAKLDHGMRLNKNDGTWFPWATKSLCQSCQDRLEEHQKDWAEKCWDNHAILCGFSSWDEVRTLRDAALGPVDCAGPHKTEIGTQMNEIRDLTLWQV